MNPSTRGEVLRRIGAARDAAAAQGLGACVAFDGDGTLWSGDVGEDHYRAMVRSSGILEPAHRALAAAAEAALVPTHGTASELALRILHAHEAGAFPEPTLYELTAWLAAGWTRGDVEAHAHALLDDLPGGFAPRLHAEALAVVDWARREGVEVVVVSASPRHVVEAAAGRLGIRPENVLAVTPCWSGDVLVSDVERPIPYADGKVTVLQKHVGFRVVCGAFGDNAFDAPMLRAAHVPVAIRPKGRLRAIAHEVPGLVELEVVV